jgi:chromosomal replication initiation ATPase DnaA
MDVCACARRPAATATEKGQKHACIERAAMGSNRMTDAAWSTVRNSLKGVIGDNNFVTWIAPLKLSGSRDGVVHLSAPTNFVANWVNRHYADHILRCILASGESVSRVEISVDARPRPLQRPAAAHAEGPAARRARAPPMMPTPPPGSTRATPSTTSSSANPTRWPMPPPAAWPKATRSPSTRSSSTAASGSARRT